MTRQPKDLWYPSWIPYPLQGLWMIGFILADGVRINILEAIDRMREKETRKRNKVPLDRR